MSKLLYDEDLFKNGKSKWNQHKRICYEITNEFKSYPCSYLFEQPIECQMKGTKEVKLLSFNIILNNISNDTYTEFKDWITDMKLLLLSQCKVHKRDGEFAVGFSYIQKLSKKIKKFNLTSCKGWNQTIKFYKLKIDSLLQTAPPAAQKYFPSTIPQISYVTKKLASSQINYILENYHKIQNPNDIHSILNIIRLDINASEPKDGLLDVNLFELSVPTRCKIYDFMKFKLKEEEEDHAIKM